MKSSILVVGPSWVGDMVMAQSLFMRLKQREPEAAIDVLAPGWSLPLIARMPEVRAGIEMPLGHGTLEIGVRRALGHSLREKKYDQAIVLPGSWKSALVPFFAGIPRRTGFRGEMRYGLLNDIRPLDKNLLKTTVQRFVALAEDRALVGAPLIPVPSLRVDAGNGAALAQKLGLGDGPAVGLMPGAEYGPAKQWPAEYYGALAKSLAESGTRSWVFGSQKEAGLGEEIRVASGGVAINLCGQTQLADVVDLAARCQAVVTNDSGLMHVAAAAGVPVVAIYGSSTPDFTPPLTDRKHIHYLRLSCSPCFQRTCPLIHYNCLRQIEPQAVHESLRRLTAPVPAGITWRGFEDTIALLNERSRPVLAFIADADGVHAPFLRELLRALPANVNLRRLLDGPCAAMLLQANALPGELAMLGAGSRYHVAVLAPAGLTPMVTFDHATGKPEALVEEIARVLAKLAPQWQ